MRVREICTDRMRESSRSKPVLAPANSETDKKQPAAGTGDSDGDQGEDNIAVATPDRAELFDQAAKWLASETIKTAPKEEKISFLRNKGLASEDIAKLLEASSSDSLSEESPLRAATIDGASNSDTNAPPVSTPGPSSPSAWQTPPPIITYPETLLRSHAPSQTPLVTAGGIASFVYGAFGIASGVYMASKHIVQPMVDGLVSARIELAETTIRNLEAMNQKLEGIVSRVPNDSLLASETEKEGPKTQANGLQQYDSEDSSQPGPPSLRGVGDSMISTKSREHKQDSWDTVSEVERHTTSIRRLSSRLYNILNYDEGETLKTADARDCLTDVQTYLDRLAYSVPFTLNTFGYPMSDRLTSARSNSPGDGDALLNLRAEIRSLKGAMLNAKNFPNPSITSRSRSESPAKPWQQLR